jgi:dephospho-CoA kinase
MLIVGLTGGIGSGKSTVSRCFSELGVPVVDADEIAREVVAPGQPALEEIGHAFGPSVMDDQGRLRRDRLRRLVFSDPAQRRRLEHILHPRIRQVMARRLARLSAPYCIVSIPLLVETDQRDMVHRVLVIDAPEALQYERIRRRDGASDADIAAIIATQAGREQRLAAADDVIVNDGDVDKLKQAVRHLHQHYSELTAYAPPK